MKYDFDYLKNLYIEDPKKFKEITGAMIDDVINSAREDQREIYRAKQWRLDHDLSKVHDPIERMNRMVSIFWKGVNEFVTVTKNLDCVVKTTVKEDKASCNIVDFKKKSDD